MDDYKRRSAPAMIQSMKVKSASTVFAAIALCLLTDVSANALDIYVSRGGDDRNSGTNSSSPFQTIAAASNRANAGDTIWIMPGQYAETISPKRSGKADSPIVYRAADAKSHPVLTTGTAINIRALSYITVDAIDVNGGKRAPDSSVNVLANIEKASHIVIQNCDLRNAPTGIKVRNSNNVTIAGNKIDFVGDILAASGHATGDSINVDAPSTRILISDNDIRHGGHNLINMNGSESVIRGNFLDSSWRDVYGGDAGYRSAAVKGRFNVFERNHLARNGVGGSKGKSVVLVKIIGEYNIARFNIFANSTQQAVSTEAAEYSPVSVGARIYNNTFYNLGSAAWHVLFYSGGGSIGQAVFVNNLVQKSRLSPDSSNKDTDVMFQVSDAGAGATADSKVIGNFFAPASGAAPRVLLDGFGDRIDISSAEARYPEFFSRNTARSVTFAVGAPVTSKDFNLAPGSAGIDAGVFLTHATQSGSGSRMLVGDAYFFSDGRGVVQGDLVQLEGAGGLARVVRIDYGGKALELDRSLEFRAGQGIAIAYQGRAPDVGAFEFGGSDVVVPVNPSNVAVE